MSETGLDPGQLGAVLQKAKTPYRMAKAPKLHGDLLRIITQQDHQVVACATVCLCLLHPPLAGPFRRPGDLPQEGRVSLLCVLSLQR